MGSCKATSDKLADSPKWSPLSIAAKKDNSQIFERFWKSCPCSALHLPLSQWGLPVGPLSRQSDDGEMVIWDTRILDRIHCHFSKTDGQNVPCNVPHRFGERGGEHK